MLYVFHVDMGRMMNFDMNVAISSVENLKSTIERLHGIPAANIVLLVSGGEMLTETTQVSYYSAGTDTNPIYMFLTGDVKLPPNMPASEPPDVDLLEQVNRCLELPAVYETVVTRAQLALRMYDMARDEERLCERLVHEQHLQQQGWSAVVANIEDLTSEFRQRFKNFCSFFERHLAKRTTYLELLHNFGADLTQLSRIPILPALMSLAEEDFHGFDDLLETDDVFARAQPLEESALAVATEVKDEEAASSKQLPQEAGCDADGNNAETEKSLTSTSPNKKLKMGPEHATELAASSSQASSACSQQRRTLTLLQWISAKENHSTLRLMAEKCVQGLSTFNEEIFERLKAEVQHIIKLADDGDVKEIKRLGERLCKLEEFKFKIKNMVQDQRELSTSIQQNQNRAMNLRDASILPDLCASHQSQLLVMLQNQQKIREHRRLIAKAKDELGVNLHTRLKRIVWIENTMSEFDNRLLLNHCCLRRAEQHINIIEQIHQAPCIYVAAVTEVVRRKIFSGEFSLWASKLADDFDSIHSEEIKRRELFNASFEGHFLQKLFPGMHDMPPAFAENPLVFDVRLPHITRADIDLLTSQLPELSAHIALPDMEPVINFFVGRSGEHQRERFEELMQQRQQMKQHQRLEELQKEGAGGGGDDESETDTEEFEKVVESQVAQTPLQAHCVATSTTAIMMMARSTSTERHSVHSVETLTDENECATRAEVERLRVILAAMSKHAIDCLKLARANLASFRNDAAACQQHLHCELQTLNEQCALMRMRSESSAQQLQQLQQLADERQTQVLQLQTQLMERDTQLEALQTQLAQERALQQQTEASAVAAVREQLIHEHKTEIESLRCRFKLMTSMERTPSDSSLEKIEGTAAGINNNTIDIATHEAICTQIRSELQTLKQQELAVALEAERSIWQSKIFPMNSESVLANVSVLKQLLEDKERQVEMLRNKDLMMTKENFQLLKRLDALTNEDGNSWMREKIEYLARDKNRLEEELNAEKSRRAEMETSFAALRSSTYEQSTATGTRIKSSGNQKHIVLESCGKGDIVFVVWSVRHGQFMVVQDSLSLYFVHADSLSALNLRLPTTPESGSALDEPAAMPLPYYAIGRVTEKEYCQARKDENRYRVTRGSKFYRIKLAPLTSKQTTRRERLESFSTSISRSVSQSDTQSDISAAAAQRVSTGSAVIAASASGAKDVVDFAVRSTASTTTVATSPTIIVESMAGVPAYLSCKERTISITSVNEDDDEPVTLLSERCRYISVSEEEEPTTAAQQQQQQKQTTVITEQPTASATTNLKLNLMLASADIPHITSDMSLMMTASSSSPTATIAAAVSGGGAVGDDTVIVDAIAMSPTHTTTIAEVTAAAGTSMIAPTASCVSPSIPASVGTSEDSDEYRSLEPKDDYDTEFPLLE